MRQRLDQGVAELKQPERGGGGSSAQHRHSTGQPPLSDQRNRLGKSRHPWAVDSEQRAHHPAEHQQAGQGGHAEVQPPRKAIPPKAGQPLQHRVQLPVERLAKRRHAAEADPFGEVVDQHEKPTVAAVIAVALHQVADHASREAPIARVAQHLVDEGRGVAHGKEPALGPHLPGHGHRHWLFARRPHLQHRRQVGMHKPRSVVEHDAVDAQDRRVAAPHRPSSRIEGWLGHWQGGLVAQKRQRPGGQAAAANAKVGEQAVASSVVVHHRQPTARPQKGRRLLPIHVLGGVQQQNAVRASQKPPVEHRAHDHALLAELGSGQLEKLGATLPARVVEVEGPRMGGSAEREPERQRTEQRHARPIGLPPPSEP